MPAQLISDKVERQRVLWVLKYQTPDYEVVIDTDILAEFAPKRRGVTTGSVQQLLYAPSLSDLFIPRKTYDKLT